MKFTYKAKFDFVSHIRYLHRRLGHRLVLIQHGYAVRTIIPRRQIWVLECRFGYSYMGLFLCMNASKHQTNSISYLEEPVTNYLCLCPFAVCKGYTSKVGISQNDVVIVFGVVV